MFGVCWFCCVLFVFACACDVTLKLDTIVCCRCLSVVLFSLYFFIILLGLFLASSSAACSA